MKCFSISVNVVVFVRVDAVVATCVVVFVVLPVVVIVAATV